MSEQKKEKLAQRVSDLPEIYQPVYGHDELSADVSRSCADRLEAVCRVYDALRKKLDRPLRVLDLGCAQGFFSSNLAERGAEVVGVDLLDKNIAVCDALAEEHPEFNVQFETGQLEELTEQFAEQSFDLVLCLSVLHHIVHEKGVDAAKQIVDALAESSGMLLIETALKEEPLYWAEAQPEDPRTFFENCAFVQESARHPTHLSDVNRPMYAVSNRFWVVGGLCGDIESWTDDPHAFAEGTHQNSRRYFFGPNAVVKRYCFHHSRGWLNRQEFEREVAFFEKVPDGFSAPACLATSVCEVEGWVVLERLPGQLLLELLENKADLDRMSVLRSVLEQLAVLEAAGLYHNDVRAWNILIEPDGATILLDAGSISSDQQDCVWPENIFLSFFIFVHELLTGEIAPTDSLRLHRMTPYSLPSPYRDWAASIWRYSVEEWSFALMLDRLSFADEQDVVLNRPLGEWIGAIDLALEGQVECLRYLRPLAEEGGEIAEDLLEAVDRMEQAVQVIEEKTCRVMADEEARRAQAEGQAETAEERAVFSEARSQQSVRMALNEATRANQAEQRTQQLETDLSTIRERLFQETQRFQQQRTQIKGQLTHREEELAQAEAERDELAVSVKTLEVTEKELRDQVGELNYMAGHWWAVADSYRQQLEDVHRSRCVRWTAPLRWVSRQRRRLREEGLFVRLKALGKKILRNIKHKGRRTPPQAVSVDTDLASGESTPQNSQAGKDLSVDELLSRIRNEVNDSKREGGLKE